MTEPIATPAGEPGPATAGTAQRRPADRPTENQARAGSEPTGGPTSAEGDGSEGRPASRPRRRGSRGGRGRAPAVARTADDASDAEAESPDALPDQTAPRPPPGSRPALATDGTASRPPRARRSSSASGASASGGGSGASGTGTSGGSGASTSPTTGTTGGGRGRQVKAGVVPATPPPNDHDLPDLPERLREGKPSREAADRATVRRPKIGDTRPVRTGGVGNDGGAGDDEAHADGSADDGTDEPGTGPRRRRRRGGRGRSGAGAARAGADALDLDDRVILDDDTLERRRGRERKGRPVGRYLMCVSSQPHATQIAVLEGRSLLEHYVSRPADDTTQIHGNIYLGKVQNVLPGMEAAFVDIGTPKNAVLYRGDVQYDPEDVEEGAGARIENLLRAGQTVLCQVTKNPIGTKGARLTQEVSLAGRFVVLLPGSTTYGISKRLPDEERKRLRKILDDVRPEGHGLIVRTAAEGATPDELRRDVERLRRQWQHIHQLSQKKGAPALLYREPTLAVRVIREEFNKDYRGVIIDDPALYTEVHDYVSSLIPELADRVELYDDTSLPLFERQHIHEQLHRALDRKVWLPSGGSLIIERTEALTVIDVNTGKNVGKSSLEETVYRNNLEAADEVARQLRLRDIGGIIVIDFIDMESRKNRDAVLRAFKEALARDKTRTQVFDISELGLVEMTRKRVSEGLVESFSTTCPTCKGRGIVIDESLL